MLAVAGGEGAALLTTDYPPTALLPWMSFRDHNRVAAVHVGFIAGLGLLMPGLPPRDRRVLLALASVPLVLRALSDTRERPAPAPPQPARVPPAPAAVAASPS